MPERPDPSSRRISYCPRYRANDRLPSLRDRMAATALPSSYATPYVARKSRARRMRFGLAGGLPGIPSPRTTEHHPTQIVNCGGDESGGNEQTEYAEQRHQTRAQ